MKRYLFSRMVATGVVVVLIGLGIFTGYTMGGVIHDIKEKKALKVQNEIGQLKKGRCR